VDRSIKLLTDENRRPWFVSSSPRSENTHVCTIENICVSQSCMVLSLGVVFAQFWCRPVTKRASQACRGSESAGRVPRPPFPAPPSAERGEYPAADPRKRIRVRADVIGHVRINYVFKISVMHG